MKLAKSGHVKDMKKLRDYIIEKVLEIPDSELNGPRGDRRLCNNLNFIFHGAQGESVGGYLDAKGICSSTGSACSSHSLEPSHVLRAIGRSTEEALSALRLSISRFTTQKEADYLLEVLPGIVEKLRKSRKPVKNGVVNDCG